MLFYLQNNHKSKSSEHDVRERQLPQKHKGDQHSLPQDSHQGGYTPLFRSLYLLHSYLFINESLLDSPSKLIL